MSLQNAAMQQQLHSLFEKVATLREEKLRLTKQLSHSRQSLEAGKEDQQMLKLTLSEKNSQLLHAEDQLL